MQSNRKEDTSREKREKPNEVEQGGGAHNTYGSNLKKELRLEGDGQNKKREEPKGLYRLVIPYTGIHP